METEDIILIKDRITTRIKIQIKEDTGTISDVTIEEETIIEETNTDGTFVDIIQKNDNRNNNLQHYDNKNAETTWNTGNSEGHNETTTFPQKVCCSCE